MRFQFHVGFFSCGLVSGILCDFALDTVKHVVLCLNRLFCHIIFVRGFLYDSWRGWLKNIKNVRPFALKQYLKHLFFFFFYDSVPMMLCGLGLVFIFLCLALLKVFQRLFSFYMLVGFLSIIQVSDLFLFSCF